MGKALYGLVLVTVFFISCKRDQIEPTGLPPIANAGQDQQFTSVPDSVILDGTASTNAGGQISAFGWSEIFGPSYPAKIVNPSSKRTVVKNLTTGTYQFELRVKGNGGLYARDTVQIQIVQEYILSSIWRNWSEPTGEANYIFIDPSSTFSIATMAYSRIEVSIQLDSSSLWNDVVPWDWHAQIPAPAGNRYIWYFPHFPYYDSPGFTIASSPADYGFVDKAVKVKVKFF